MGIVGDVESLCAAVFAQGPVKVLWALLGRALLSVPLSALHEALAQQAAVR